MIKNLIRVLMWFTTDAYSSFVFDIFSANAQSFVVCSRPHPPNLVFGRGVKVPFSICSQKLFKGVVSRNDGE